MKGIIGTCSGEGSKKSMVKRVAFDYMIGEANSLSLVFLVVLVQVRWCPFHQYLTQLLKFMIHRPS
jgi:hypothetical protein